MDEYISREVTAKAFCEKCKGYYDGYCVHRGECDIDVIQTAPSADVQPVIHAYWIELPKALNPNENPCKCSNCGHILSFMNGYPKSKYCDDCGAKMDIIYEDDKIRAIKVTG